MEEIIMNEIDVIIQMLEESEYDAYTFSDNKLHIIDKEEEIDFQAKLANNNYYFKDNIRDFLYMKSKKYIDDNTTIQQIIIEKSGDNYYFCFLERDTYNQMIRTIKSSKNDVLDCRNLAVMNCSWDEMIQYADTVFEDLEEIKKIDKVFNQNFNYNKLDDSYFIGKLENKKEDEYDEEINDVDEYNDEEIIGIDEDEYENEYENEYEDEYEENDEIDEIDYKQEFEQIDENMKSGLSNVFEDNSIKQYLKYIQQKLKEEKELDDECNANEYSEAYKQYYDEYQVKINNQKIDGTAKCRIVADCEASVDQNSYDSILIDEGVVNLKSVVQAVQKSMENDANSGEKEIKDER